MSDDLLRLGAQLEAATSRAVRRRRARLHTARGAIASLLLAVPVVLGTAPGHLAGGAGPLPAVPRVMDVTRMPPTYGFLERHIPDEISESQVRLPCLDARDCRAPRPSSMPPVRPGKV